MCVGWRCLSLTCSYGKNVIWIILNNYPFLSWNIFCSLCWPVLKKATSVLPAVTSTPSSLIGTGWTYSTVHCDHPNWNQQTLGSISLVLVLSVNWITCFTLFKQLVFTALYLQTKTTFYACFSPAVIFSLRHLWHFPVIVMYIYFKENFAMLSRPVAEIAMA